jgi:aspartate/methionine/tyrosine aminotransferase
MPIEEESPEETGYATIQYNLAESSVRDISFKDLKIDLDELVICYGEHRGDIKLRTAIIADSPGLQATDVLVCPGAATALFMIATTLLQPANHLIVIRPNYATNIETPRAISCELTTIDLKMENGFQLDIQQIINSIQSNTRLISLTTPHNPTGVEFPAETIAEIIAFAKEKNIFVLVDETYRYLNFQTPLQPYYAELGDHVISVSSLSKAFGVPGIRIGWLINKNEPLMLELLAAKEQIIIANSVVDESIALHILQRKQAFLDPAHRHIRSNFLIFKNWMRDNPYFEWTEPTAGVVAFPRIRSNWDIDLPLFYKTLYESYHTMVGAGHWFEHDDRYMRIGFGFPTEAELKSGLEHITSALEASIK